MIVSPTSSISLEIDVWRNLSTTLLSGLVGRKDLDLGSVATSGNLLQRTFTILALGAGD
jgi:hypothetical protein